MVLRVDRRARNFIFRTKVDGIYITMPPYATQTDLENALEELRPKLEKNRKEVPQKSAVGLGYSIEVPDFKMEIVEGTGSGVVSRFNDGCMRVECPAGTDFNDVHLQKWLEKQLERGLKYSASLHLFPRLYRLSAKTGLTYTSLKITVSKGRWGSCSQTGSINLSCYLMTLPDHLIDYVLLHELCHTVEMNHGPQFWDLLNKYTGGRAQALRQELHSHSTAELWR